MYENVLVRSSLMENSKPPEMDITSRDGFPTVLSNPSFPLIQHSCLLQQSYQQHSWLDHFTKLVLVPSRKLGILPMILTVIWPEPNFLLTRKRNGTIYCQLLGSEWTIYSCSITVIINYLKWPILSINHLYVSLVCAQNLPPVPR